METTIQSPNLEGLQTVLNDAMFEEDWYMQGDIYFQAGFFKIRLFRLPPSAVETALLALDEPPESPTFLPHLSSLLASAARAPLRLPAIAASAAARLGDTGLFDRLRGGDYDVFVPLFENLSGAPRDNPRELARISVLLDYFSGETDDPTLWEYAQEQWETLARGLDMSDDLAAARRWLQQVVRPKERSEALVREKIDEVQPAVAALAAAAIAVQETADAAAQFSAFDGKLAQVRNELMGPKLKIVKNTVDVERNADDLKAISAAIMRILEEAKAAVLEKQKKDMTQKNQATRIQRAAKRSLNKNAVPVDELAAAAIDPTVAEQANTEAQNQAFADWIAEANNQAGAIGAAHGAAERVAAETVGAAQQAAQVAADARAAAAQAAAAEAISANSLEVAAAVAKLEGNETAVNEAAAEAEQSAAEAAKNAELLAEAYAQAAEDAAVQAKTQADALAENAEQANQTAVMAAEAEAERDAQTAAAITQHAENAAAEAETAETLQLELAANEAAAKQTAEEAKEAERVQTALFQEVEAIADRAVAETKEAEEALAAAKTGVDAEAANAFAEAKAAQELEAKAAQDQQAVQQAQASIEQVETNASTLHRSLQQVIGRSKHAAERVILNEQEALEKEKEKKIRDGWAAEKVREAAKAIEDRKAAEEARTAAEKGVAGKAVSFSKKQAREVEAYAIAADGLAKEAAKAALAQATPDLNEILTNFIISVDVIKTILYILSDGTVDETTTKIIEAESTALELLKDTEPVPIHFIKADALRRSTLLEERTRAIMQGQIPDDVHAKIQTKFQELTEASTLDEIQKAEVEIAVELATIVRSGVESEKMDTLAKDYLTRWLLTNDGANEQTLRVLHDVKAEQEAERDDSKAEQEAERDDSKADAFESQEAELPVEARTEEEMAAQKRFYELNPEEIYVTGKDVEGVYTRESPYQGVGDPLVLTYTQQDRTTTINMIKEGDKYTFKMQFGDKLYPTNVDSDAQRVSVLDIELYEKPGLIFKSQFPVAVYDNTEEKHPAEIFLTSATPEFNGLFTKEGNRYTGDGLVINISKIGKNMQYTVAGFHPVDQLVGDVAFVDKSDPIKQAEVRIQPVANAIDEAMQAAEKAAQEAEANVGEVGEFKAVVEQTSAAAQEKAAEAKATAEAEATAAAQVVADASASVADASTNVQQNVSTATSIAAEALVKAQEKVKADDSADIQQRYRAASEQLQQNKRQTAAAAVAFAEGEAANVATQAGLAAQVQTAAEAARVAALDEAVHHAQTAVVKAGAAATELDLQAKLAAQVETDVEKSAHFVDPVIGRKKPLSPAEKIEANLSDRSAQAGIFKVSPEREQGKLKTQAWAADAKEIKKVRKEQMEKALHEIELVKGEQNAIAAAAAELQQTTAAATQAARAEAQRLAEVARAEEAAAAEAARAEEARLAEVARAEAAAATEVARTEVARVQEEAARIKEVERNAAAVAAKKRNAEYLPQPVTPLVLLSSIPEINGLYTVAPDEDFPILYKSGKNTILYQETDQTFRIGSDFVIKKDGPNLLNRYEQGKKVLNIVNFIPELKLSIQDKNTNITEPPFQGVYTSTDGLQYKSGDNRFAYDSEKDCFSLLVSGDQYLSSEKVYPFRENSYEKFPNFGKRYINPKLPNRFDQSLYIGFQMAIDEPAEAAAAEAAAAAPLRKFTLSEIKPAFKDLGTEKVLFQGTQRGTQMPEIINLVDLIVGAYTYTEGGYEKDDHTIRFNLKEKKLIAKVQKMHTSHTTPRIQKSETVTYTISNIKHPESDPNLHVKYTEGPKTFEKTTKIHIIFH